MGEEFYAIIKLTSGEEILSVVCVDESEDEAVIILNNPVAMKYINHPGMRSLVKVKPWLELSDQDIFVIRQDKIINVLNTIFYSIRYHIFTKHIINKIWFI